MLCRRRGNKGTKCFGNFNLRHPSKNAASVRRWSIAPPPPSLVPSSNSLLCQPAPPVLITNTVPLNTSKRWVHIVIVKDWICDEILLKYYRFFLSCALCSVDSPRCIFRWTDCCRHRYIYFFFIDCSFWDK